MQFVDLSLQKIFHYFSFFKFQSAEKLENSLIVHKASLKQIKLKKDEIMSTANSLSLISMDNLSNSSDCSDL